MILKCIECQEPMTPTTKGRPEGLPDTVEWFACRQCDKGIEVVKSDTDKPAEDVKTMEFEEVVTITQYCVLKKTKAGVTKYKYSDPEHKNLIGEEKLG